MAAWSPDGQRILFVSDRDGPQGDIYVMNRDGSDQHRLAAAPGEDVRPQWSPDGSHILFQTDRDGSAQIYVMNADGSNQQRLTTNGNNMHPRWAANGAQIVFVSDRLGPRGLFVMDANGQNVQLIGMSQQGIFSYERPSWTDKYSR
jgi:Tol biopolymer transport system component